MKAIILAAGKGKRFGDITRTLPKPLIKLGDITLIEHNILLLKEYGFNDLVINVSHLSDMIIDFLGNGKKYNVNIKYSVEKPEPYETGGGIQNALHLLGKSPFLVINADIYTNCNLSNISIKQDDLASIVMVKNPEHHIDGDFSLTNGRITLANKNTMTYSGIGIYNPIIFSDIKSKKYKLSEILLKNIIKDKVSGSEHTDIWFDVGDVKKLKNVNKLFF
ncbi:nucleotidyltransferase family protein [Gammaproteobacteria bacterium]|nr:nucleotidyltransferase family protein [Gammaproteobacteria bacterium]